MKEFVSIRKKLTLSTMLIISLIFLAVLSIVTWINIRTVQRSVKKSEISIHNALIARGNTLIRNNSMAMSGMVEDNAFTAVRELVVSTVKGDPDLLYGIYMDHSRFPWVYASPEHPEGNAAPALLEDEMSLWAAGLNSGAAYREYMYKNEAVIEFAAPVPVEKEIYGFIRYGFTTRSMEKLLREARAEGLRSRNMVVIILAGLGFCSLIFSFLIVRQLSNRITQPVAALVESTRTIAEGNYNVPVISDSNDELGLLVRDVDRMRVSIRDLTENLREQERLKKEMELARKIQTSLLPHSVRNIHPDFDIAADMLPAEQVGGDFYDVTYDRIGHLWIAIGDVSGHGVTPGLIMMMAQTIHATVTTAHFDCDARGVVIMINRILYQNVSERLHEKHFMTFTVLKYLGDGYFQHSGAHLSMIVFRCGKQSCELIRTNGVYLNFKKDISKGTRNAEFFLDHGDMLILYTDGLTEARNPEGKMLDIDGFVKIVETYANQEPEMMKDRIMEDVRQWCGDKRADDMTLLVIRRNESREESKVTPPGNPAGGGASKRPEIFRYKNIEIPEV